MKKIKTFILLLLVSFIFLCGCGNNSDEPSYLPVNAYDVVDCGNGWVTFKLDGRTFLYLEKWSGYKGYAAITQITD